MASYANTFTFCLIKINASGDTIWNKSYRINGGSRDGWEQTTRLDTDGTLLCALSGDQLVKIDTNGILIWAKQIQFKYGNEKFYHIQVLDNGDKILFYQATDDGRSLMVRCSPDLGTIKWCKYFYFYYGTYTNIVIDGNKIVFAGSASDQDYSFTLYPFIASLNLSNGSLLDFRYYKSNEATGIIRSLYKCGNGYLGLSSFSFSNGSNGYVRFNGDLSVKSVNQFQGVGISDYPQTQFSFAPQTDGSFYMAYGGYFDLALSYIDNRDSLIYVEDIPGFYSFPSDLKQSVDALYITGSDNFFDVVMQRTLSNTYVIKCDFAGSPGDCEPEQKPAFTLQSHTLVRGDRTIEIRDSSISLLPIDATADTPVPLQGQKGCTKEVECNRIHIKGANGVCNNLPVNFTASRNEQCNAHITWSCDAKNNSNITTVNDSTVSVTFTRDGVFTLYAKLDTYCGTDIADSIKVSVNLSKQLDLGRDTFLCNNQIVLHAGKQFSSYWWQDGSIDSIYTVTKEGKYFVITKDYCGNTLSDTLIVDKGPSFAFSAGNDTVKCNRDTIVLTATEGFTNYKWSPSYQTISTTDRRIKVFPDRDTKYTVQAEKPAGCVVYDTVQLSVNASPAIRLGNDTSFCDGNSIMLNAGDDFETYLWNTGETTQNITVAGAGTYTVKAKKGSCFSTDTLVVNPVFPTPETKLRDTVICVNNVVILQAGSGFNSYRWQDNSHSSQYIVREAGVYWVHVIDDHGCTVTDTAVVQGPASLPDHFLTADTMKCSYDTLLLQPASAFVSYLWSNGSMRDKIKVTKADTYWLQVTDNNGCINKNYTTVTEKECKNEIYFPTAFTPNGDGHNDVFRPKVLGSLEQFHMTIYNRWGQKVFESKDWQKGWDGSVNAGVPDTESFVWIASYRLRNKETSVTKGTVVLLK